MKEWYAARIISGRERVIQFYMKQEGIRVSFPIATENRPRGDVPVRVFPGYAFFEFDVEVDWWYSIDNTHGVVGLLPRHNERPSALPCGFVDEMEGRIGRGEFSVKAASDLALSYLPGDLVPVANGPWAGHTGELVKHERGSLILLLSLFNTQMNVPIPRHQIGVRP